MSSADVIQLEPSWLSLLQDEFSKPYMLDLKAFLQQEKRQGKVIYPAGQFIFNAFNSTPYNKVKVVILGQDPYHGAGQRQSTSHHQQETQAQPTKAPDKPSPSLAMQGQAHGLSFSVRHGFAIPPSLLNIYKELKRDLSIPMPTHGCLQSWADQGVLLLNATLTVAQGQAGSHQGKGWELLTDCVVQKLNEHPSPLVFLLWGSYAQKKGQMIDAKRHLVLSSAHPSPLSAHRGFIGNGHFSKANQFLQTQNKRPIHWASLLD